MSGDFDPPYAADEPAMLLAWLEYQRQSMLHKVEGLTEEQARWKPAETANSLIGLIHHLAYVERWWFAQCFAGIREGTPEWADPKADPDWDFHPPESVTLADAVALYKQEWARGTKIATDAPSLDDVGVHPRAVKDGITLRWILVHMIEETARHAGHADITRELVDGSTGMI